MDVIAKFLARFTRSYYAGYLPSLRLHEFHVPSCLPAYPPGFGDIQIYFQRDTLVHTCIVYTSRQMLKSYFSAEQPLWGDGRNLHLWRRPQRLYLPDREGAFSNWIKCKMFCFKFIDWLSDSSYVWSVCRSRGSFVEAFLCRQRGAKLLSRGGRGGGGGRRGQAVGQLDSVQGGRRLEVPDPHITWRGARGLAGAVASLLILNFYPLFTRVTVMPCSTRMGCPKTLSDDLNANGTHCKSNGLSSWTLPYSHCYQKLSTNYWYRNTL